MKGHQNENNTPPCERWAQSLDVVTFCGDLTSTDSDLCVAVQLPRALITGTHRTWLFASFVIRADIHQREERVSAAAMSDISPTNRRSSTSLPFVWDQSGRWQLLQRLYWYEGNLFTPPPTDSSLNHTAHYYTAAQRPDMKGPAVFGAPVHGINSISFVFGCLVRAEDSTRPSKVPYWSVELMFSWFWLNIYVCVFCRCTHTVE